MKYHPDLHHRRSLRLKGYDYGRAGAYFVTIVTQDRECLFGDVVDGEMRLNPAGQIVERCWRDIPTHFPNVELDELVIMPNHLHGIIVIAYDRASAGLAPAQYDVNRATTRVAPTGGLATDGETTNSVGAGLVPAHGLAPARVTVGAVVGAFKSRTTVAYTRGVKHSGWPGFRSRLWQRNYYEHIIRSEVSLVRIREYIANNPLQWALDRENPANVRAVREPPLREPWEYT